MRKWLRIKGLVLAPALLVALVLPVTAQETSRRLVISRDASVNGAVVEAGAYTIKFDSSGDGELVVLRGKREISKSNYTLVSLPKRASESLVVFSSTDDGALKINRIEIKGFEFALKLEH